MASISPFELIASGRWLHPRLQSYALTCLPVMGAAGGGATPGMAAYLYDPATGLRLESYQHPGRLPVAPPRSGPSAAPKDGPLMPRSEPTLPSAKPANCVNDCGALGEQ